MCALGDEGEGEGDSQPIEDGAGETEEDSEGEGEDIPASQHEVIDLQTPQKEFFQDSQTPPACETRAPNECSPISDDAKKELFRDDKINKGKGVSMPPPQLVPKKYDTKIRDLELELQPL